MKVRPITDYSNAELKAIIASRNAELRKTVSKTLGVKDAGVGAARIKLRKCLGCGEMFGTVGMREHPCVISYQARFGKVFDAVTRKYTYPEDKK